MLFQLGQIRSYGHVTMRSLLGVSAIHRTIQTKHLLCLYAVYCWMTGSLCLRSSQSSERASYVNCGLTCNVISAGVCLLVTWMFLGPTSLWVQMGSNSLTELEFHWSGLLSQNADPQPIISESLRSCSCSLAWDPVMSLTCPWIYFWTLPFYCFMFCQSPDCWCSPDSWLRVPPPSLTFLSHVTLGSGLEKRTLLSISGHILSPGHEAVKQPGLCFCVSHHLLR